MSEAHRKRAYLVAPPGFAVSREESPDDRRVRIVALTKNGRDLIVPIFRKHSAEIGRVFADANPKELQIFESVLKKAGKRAKALAEKDAKPGSIKQMK